MNTFLTIVIVIFVIISLQILYGYYKNYVPSNKLAITPAGGYCDNYKECAKGLTCSNNQCYSIEKAPRKECNCSYLFFDAPLNYFLFCPSNQCNGKLCTLSTRDGKHHCELTLS